MILKRRRHTHAHEAVSCWCKGRLGRKEPYHLTGKPSHFSNALTLLEPPPGVDVCALRVARCARPSGGPPAGHGRGPGRLGDVAGATGGAAMTRVGEVALVGVGWIAGAVWWANLANTSWKRNINSG